MTQMERELADEKQKLEEAKSKITKQVYKEIQEVPGIYVIREI